METQQGVLTQKKLLSEIVLGYVWKTQLFDSSGKTEIVATIGIDSDFSYVNIGSSFTALKFGDFWDLEPSHMSQHNQWTGFSVSNKCAKLVKGKKMLVIGARDFSSLLKFVVSFLQLVMSRYQKKVLRLCFARLC